MAAQIPSFTYHEHRPSIYLIGRDLDEMGITLFLRRIFSIVRRRHRGKRYGEMEEQAFAVVYILFMFLKVAREGPISNLLFGGSGRIDIKKTAH